jgi:hypothetical protein
MNYENLNVYLDMTYARLFGFKRKLNLYNFMINIILPTLYAQSIELIYIELKIETETYIIRKHKSKSYDFVIDLCIMKK